MVRLGARRAGAPSRAGAPYLTDGARYPRCGLYPVCGLYPSCGPYPPWVQYPPCGLCRAGAGTPWIADRGASARTAVALPPGTAPVHHWPLRVARWYLRSMARDRRTTWLRICGLDRTAAVCPARVRTAWRGVIGRPWATCRARECVVRDAMVGSTRTSGRVAGFRRSVRATVERPRTSWGVDRATCGAA